jgi:hypothetical protein
VNQPRWRPEIVEEPQEKTDSSNALAEALLDRLLNLKALSQRALIAIADAFSLLTVATVFWLSMTIIPHEPTIYQLVGLGGYACFVVAVNIIVRRK